MTIKIRTHPIWSTKVNFLVASIFTFASILNFSVIQFLFGDHYIWFRVLCVIAAFGAGAEFEND